MGHTPSNRLGDDAVTLASAVLPNTRTGRGYGKAAKNTGAFRLQGK